MNDSFLSDEPVTGVRLSPLVSMEMGTCDPRHDDESNVQPELAIVTDIATSETRIRPRPQSMGGVVGESDAIIELFAMVDRVGRCESTVLITGESGTGKELVARAVHQRSRRTEGPFVVVNWNALPGTFVASTAVPLVLHAPPSWFFCKRWKLAAVPDVSVNLIFTWLPATVSEFSVMIVPPATAETVFAVPKSVGNSVKMTPRAWSK